MYTASVPPEHKSAYTYMHSLVLECALEFPNTPLPMIHRSLIVISRDFANASELDIGNYRAALHNCLPCLPSILVDFCDPHCTEH